MVFFLLIIQTITTDTYGCWPRSANDQTNFNNSLVKKNFEDRLFENGQLLGDSDYICIYLLTPLIRSSQKLNVISPILKNAIPYKDNM